MQPVGIRGNALLSRLPDGVPLAGAEVGVFTGALSSLLLQARPQLTLFMVDNWLGSDEQPAAYVTCGDWHAQQTRQAQASYRGRALGAVKFAGARAQICHQGSIAAAAAMEPGVLDFVFIDADHSYEGCAADIEAWRSRLRGGGLLCGHDYDHPVRTGFGVKRAVDEACARHGWALELDEDMTWFVRFPQETERC